MDGRGDIELPERFYWPPWFDEEPRKPREGFFPHLRRSMAPWAPVEVDLIESASRRAPPGIRDRWQKQLSSTRDEFALGAYTEVMVATVLWNRGYELRFDVVVAGGKTPDIVAYREGVPLFVVEVTGSLDGDLREKARLEQVTRAVDSMHLEDFMVSVGVGSIGHKTPPAKALQRKILSWVAALPSVGIENSRLRWPEAPEERFESGWDLTFSIATRPECLRGTGCLFSTRWAGTCDNKAPLAAKLSEKSKKYLSLELPFVVALNWLRPVPILPFEVDCVLFGGAGCIPLDGARRSSDQPLFDMAPWAYVEQQIAERRGEGFWQASSGKPRNRNVSAVLLMTNVCPGGHFFAAWHLWMNSYAEHAVERSWIGAPVVDAHPALFPHRVLPGTDWPTALGVR